MPADLEHPHVSEEAIKSSLGQEACGDNEDGLAELYQGRIEPVIRKFVISKFRVSLRHDDDSRQNQDALEVLSETKVLVLQKLLQSQNGSGANAIRDLEAYVRTTASNVFNQYLRRKYPRRLSLKNQLRYLLTHHRDLSLWNVDGDQWICGPRTLTGGRRSDPKRIELTGEQRVDLCARVNKFRGKSNGREIIEFTVGLFEYHRAPATLDDLIMTAIDLLNIDEPVEVAEPENVAELESSHDRTTALSKLEDNEFVRHLWDEIKLLPVQHRVVLLLNFNDDSGGDLVAMLPVMRIASVRQIADTLGFSHRDFSNVWNELPWDDNRIASHLGVTRQQVINLRQSARQMLRRKLRPEN